MPEKKKQKKISLILSGGAIHGAAQVGFLQAILEKYSYDDIEVITGTSVGSINGAMIAQRDYETLDEIWKGLHSWRDLYSKWFFRILSGFFRGGLWNFRPTERLIQKCVDVDKLIKSPIKYFATSVNRVNEDVCYTENSEKNRDILLKQILASSSIPFSFPPVRIGESQFVDGGVVEPIPVEKAVKTAKHTKLFIILLANPLEFNYIHKPKPNLYDVAWESIDTMFHEIFKGDVVKGTERYWNQTKDRFLILQPSKFYFDSSFDVDQDKIIKCRQDCYKIARSALKNLP